MPTTTAKGRHRAQEHGAGSGGELRASIATATEGGWIARIGDDRRGWRDEKAFDSFDDAQEWLHAKAVQLYPGSDLVGSRPAGRLAIPADKEHDLIRKQAAALIRARHELETSHGTVATDRPDLVQAPPNTTWKVDHSTLTKQIAEVLRETFEADPASRSGAMSDG
jgi:hypothetical protein